MNHRHHALNRAVLITSALAAATLSSTLWAKPVVVTNGDDSGEGSLRAALESGAREIVIATNEDIMTTATLTYAGEKSLSIYGNGQTVMASGDYTVFEVSEGASLTVVGLNFMGMGGYSIENQGTGKGIFLDVRDQQSGTVRMSLTNVTVSGVANHGIHVSDCSLADDCGGGSGGAGGGSAAGIVVNLTNTVVDDAGNGKFDADGFRVDERDRGNIIFNATGSTFTNVGADGVELDEGQNGEVIATVSDSEFTMNGTYCDPELLAQFLPEPDEREDIPEGEVMLEDIAPVDTPDDGCFEVEYEEHPDGSLSEYEVGLDLDDGFDIDEAGQGSLKARIYASTVDGNDDEGLDFDEEDQGKIDLVTVGVVASNNRDDGIKLSEEDQGNVAVTVIATTTENNGGKGMVFEEADQGSMDALVQDSSTAGNDDGEVGIEAVQEDQGTGTLRLVSTTVAEDPGVEVEGVDVIEE